MQLSEKVFKHIQLLLFMLLIKESLENHISTKKINETLLNITPQNFHLKEVSRDDVKNEIHNLNVKKQSIHGLISSSI